MTLRLLLLIGYVSGEFHGFIIPSTDQSSAIQWSFHLMYEDVSGALNAALGTGGINTAAIIAAAPSFTSAAKVCSDLIVGEYGDWVMPSKDELYKIYISRVVLGIINNQFYISSTTNQDGFDYEHCIGIDFLTGSYISIIRDDEMYLRAIRYF